MTIEIPDDVFKSPIDKNKLVIDLAAELYRQQKVSLGRAAEIAGIPKMKMQDEIAKRDIEIIFTMEMYHQDINAVNFYLKEKERNDSSK